MRLFYEQLSFGQKLRADKIKQLNCYLNESDLSLLQLNIMIHLTDSNEENCQTIQIKFNLDENEVKNLVKPLCEHNYIYIKDNFYFLTENGQTKVEKALDFLH